MNKAWVGEPAHGSPPFYLNIIQTRKVVDISFRRKTDDMVGRFNLFKRRLWCVTKTYPG